MEHYKEQANFGSGCSKAGHLASNARGQMPSWLSINEFTSSFFTHMTLSNLIPSSTLMPHKGFLNAATPSRLATTTRAEIEQRRYSASLLDTTTQISPSTVDVAEAGSRRLGGFSVHLTPLSTVILAETG
jgi:hypothetical protein